MRILVESQFFYPEQMRINDICVALAASGHIVTVVTSIPNYPKGKFFSGYGFFHKRRETYQGVSIIHLPVIPRGKGFIGLTLNYISFVVSGWFFAHLTREKADVVFMNMSSPMTQSLVGVWFAKRRKIPSAIYILDLWPESFEVITGISSPMVIKPIGRMVDGIYRRTDKVLTSSRSFIEAIAERGVPSEKLLFWPQYAEEFYQPLERDPLDQTLLAHVSRLTFTFTGNIGLAQGLDILIPVALLLKEQGIPVRFVLVGDGSDKERLLDLVVTNNLEDWFVFIERQPAEKIPALLSASDAGLVILKKSAIFSKTIPAKVQSYLACGVPILVSADGEVQQVVSEAKAGFVTDAEDAQGLFNIIVSFSSLSKPERLEMGKQAKLYSDRMYSKEILIDQLENVLHSLVKDTTHV
ncbi:glycosyltransferase family 4 protein [Sphaerochaeta sp. PS]|uniref:glycosyltransferase family 4 protein n=1 Tax=Sphaerochaeta sp. PS TaxID=3076336 RepID=UPI0028A4E91E|nr:glycosyltransferase family 4 protein [Sphaerochaeta sp. PS]MDT4763366.1 glycosyltransferase family 4 protein [Sphaerochaeta sp. PS]